MSSDVELKMWKIGEEIRSIKRHLKTIEARNADPIINKTIIYPTIETPNLENPVINNPDVTDGRWTDITIDGTTTDIEAGTVYFDNNTGGIIYQNGTNDATLTKTQDENKLVFDGSGQWDNVLAGANSIKIGDEFTWSISANNLVLNPGTGRQIVHENLTDIQWKAPLTYYVFLHLDEGIIFEYAGADIVYHRLNTSNAAEFQVYNDQNHLDVRIKEVEAGATWGPDLILERSSLSPADGDELGRILFQGYNDAGTPELGTYAYIGGKTVDVSDGTEDGKLVIANIYGGSLLECEIQVRAANDLYVMGDLFSTGNLQSGGTLTLLNGTSINELSIDDTLAGDSDDAVPTEQAVKAYVDNKDYTAVDSVKGGSISTFLHLSHANHIMGYVGSQSTQLQVTTTGITQNATGAQYVYLDFMPPAWLTRYANQHSKTLTLTQIALQWNNTVSADYINAVYYYWIDHNTAGTSTLYSSGTNLGQGSTGFRSDTLNGTDRVMVEGDLIHLRLDLQQGTANSCRIYGINVTYTIA